MNEYPFSFSPSLIILLGEQLIHDKKIALAELVKNSYDADASYVIINIAEDSIEIIDDGTGMNLDVITKIWFNPGVSPKEKRFKILDITPKYNRLPIGEKGIGRLGCHRLGSKIEVFSKAKSCSEIHFSIDWKTFAENQSTPRIKVEEFNCPKVFKENSTGTKLIISSLKEKWDKKEDYTDTQRNLLNLIDPFSTKENFKILFKKNEELLANDLHSTLKFIKENALYYFKAKVEKGKLIDFEYRFSPWSCLDKVEKREISLKKGDKEMEKYFPKSLSPETIENSSEIKRFVFEGYIYDFDNELLSKKFNIKEKKDLKTYMKKSGGIRVYRDDFRIFNYGEKGNDILDLDLKRVNRPAGKISSNQILASIKIERERGQWRTDRKNE